MFKKYSEDLFEGPNVFWTSNLEIGIKEIDDQHIQLTKMIGIAYHVTHETNDETMDKLINDLLAYTVYHFETEERFFKGMAEIHKQEHEYFITRIKGFRTKFDSGRKDLGLEVFCFLKEWAIKHVLTMDKHEDWNRNL